ARSRNQERGGKDQGRKSQALEVRKEAPAALEQEKSRDDGGYPVRQQKVTGGGAEHSGSPREDTKGERCGLDIHVPVEALPVAQAIDDRPGKRRVVEGIEPPSGGPDAGCGCHQDQRDLGHPAAKRSRETWRRGCFRHSYRLAQRLTSLPHYCATREAG